MVNKMRSCINGSNSVDIKSSTVKILFQIPPKENNSKFNKNYPIARWKHTSVVNQNHLYIMGGCSYTAILKDLWSFDLTAFSESVQDQVCIKGLWNEFDVHNYHIDLWKDLSNFIGDIPPLQAHTMVSHANQLYIFGGTFVYDAKDCPLWVYSIEFQIMRKWKSVDNDEIPVPRRNHSCSIYRDIMLIFGGFGDVRGSFGDLWSFDLITEKWSLLWSFQKATKGVTSNVGRGSPCPRHDHMTVIHGNCLWVYGGMSGLEECNDLWKWNIEVSQWTKINFKIGPVDVRYISNIIIRQNWVFYVVNESKKKCEAWKYSFRANKWTYDCSNFLCELAPHSTISLFCNDSNRNLSIYKFDHLNFRRNKVHPLSDLSFDTKQSTNCLCLTSCNTISPVKNNQMPGNVNYDSLTPVDLSQESYAYSNAHYSDQLETTFTDSCDDSVTVSVPKSKEYIFLLGNNIDKATFESDIGIQFSLLR